MHKIKGLITSIKGNQQASLIILPFNKRIEDYLKIIKRINLIYDKLFIQPYASFILQLSNLNKTLIEDTKSIKNKPQSHFFIVETFIDVQKIIKSTNHQIKNYSSDGFNAIIDQCRSIKKICDLLNQKLHLHETKEKQLNQNIKKYSKSYKNFMQALDSYKIAFQDVKLIYNIEQKIKRYKQCSVFFTSSVSDLQEIQEGIKLLTGERSDLKDLLESFKQKSLEFIRIIGQQVIKIPQNITKCLMKSSKEILKLLGQKSKILKQKPVKSIFQKFRLPFPNPEFFDCELKESENGLYPSFLVNLKNMKVEYFGKCKKFLVEYYIFVREDIKNRYEINQRLKSYFTGVNNLFDKHFTTEQKDMKDLLNQKYMKAIDMCFSEAQKQVNPNGSLKISDTLQKIVEFLDENRQLTKNMNKMYSQHTKQIIFELQEQNKHMLFFKDEFKTKFYNLFTGKKQFKKDIQNLKSGQSQNLTLTQDEVKQLRTDILKKSEFIILLINGFNEKFKVSSGKIKSLIQVFLGEYVKHQSYETNLYEKFKFKLQEMTNIFVQIRLQQTLIKGFWLDQNNFYQSIVHENLKIRFDSQFDKINQFKKVRKPVENFDQTILNSSPQKEKSASPAKKEATGQTSSKSFGKNYEVFVQENTKFQQDQKYVSNYTCGLCDNIIISGRLYITTYRLFFHSRFNSSNIFFGETKLEIPRSDIKKIEKKYNAIIFDNSISITTVNGQIFFTSFVARDLAYDLICKTFDINIDEDVFISEQLIEMVQSQQDPEDFNINIEQQDDMPDADLEARTKEIDEMLQKDQGSDEKAQQINYQNVFSKEFTFPGLNAQKFFKIFESGQQMHYKNKTFESFWHYFKGHVHKNEQLNIEMWQPNVLDYLNPSNIKKDTPLKFSRRITANVPAPQTSIPFMPKYIECEESHELYFYSKDKYVIILKVKNSKAPYTDSFYLRYKKVVQKKDENTVRVENNLKIVFVKKTMVQGMIESKTMKESIENNKSMSDEIRKYLKYLENTLVKKNIKKGQKAQDMSTTDEDMVNGPKSVQETESEQHDSKGKELKQKLESIQKKQSFQQKLLGFSLLLNFIMLIILFHGGSSSVSKSQSGFAIPSNL